MLSLNLHPIFTVKGIERPFSFLTKNGFNNNSAHRLLHSKTRVIKLDHIEKLCEILRCEPSDLFQYIPENGKQTPLNNPLSKLIASKETENPLKNALFTLPYQQLKELTTKVNSQINEKE